MGVNAPTFVELRFTATWISNQEFVDAWWLNNYYAYGIDPDVRFQKIASGRTVFIPTIPGIPLEILLLFTYLSLSGVDPFEFACYSLVGNTGGSRVPLANQDVDT